MVRRPLRSTCRVSVAGYVKDPQIVGVVSERDDEDFVVLLRGCSGGVDVLLQQIWRLFWNMDRYVGGWETVVQGLVVDDDKEEREKVAATSLLLYVYFFYFPLGELDDGNSD